MFVGVNDPLATEQMGIINELIDQIAGLYNIFIAHNEAHQADMATKW